MNLSYSTLGQLQWHPAQPPLGPVDLSAASIRRIDDTVEMWPDALGMDGLTYDTLSALTEPGSVTARLAWLRKAATYSRGIGRRPTTG